jgi:DNA-binding NarL/FixJ family response regulator
MSTKQISQRYSIYKNSDDLFLTQREAECVSYLLYGLTIRGAAKAIGISHRTAEDYISKVVICN